MDTRSKIVERGGASAFVARQRAEGRPVAGISGFFDVLTAAHVRRMESVRRLGCALVVAVHDPAEPLMPARARAELVAALDLADCVVPVGSMSAGDVAETLGVAEWCDDRAAHDAIAAELVEYVQRRQESE